MSEYFGDVIDSYGDDEAVDDGVLVALMSPRGDTRHRITSNAWHSLVEHYRQKGYEDYSDEEFKRFFLAELLPLASFAVQAWKEGELLKTNYDFSVIHTKQSETLWFIPNEIGGVTIMKPEDY